MARRLALTTGLTGLAIVLAACGGATTGSSPAGSAESAAPATPSTTVAPTPSPTTAPTEEPSASSTAGLTGRIELAEHGIALTLPDGWVAVDMTAEDADEIMDAFPDGTYTEAQQDMVRAAIGSGIKLFAFDGDGSGSNVNLIVQDTAVPVTLLETMLPTQFEQVPGASNLKITHGTALGEDALYATYDLDQPVPTGGSIPVEGTAVYVSANGRLYALTVSQMGASDDDAGALIDSLETLP